ncbi:hypothetical protein [Cyanobacterium sp. uoEpiScrs1]|nr:hypothetical protein [Cyanobacterium sp. uoEpiScrs1]
MAAILSLKNFQLNFPNAPFSHPKISGGRAWYDLETRNYQG